ATWRGGTWAVLPTPAGLGDGYAAAINARGHVAGWATDPAGMPRALLWADGAVRDLGTLPGATCALAYGLDDADAVVGQAGCTDPQTGADVPGRAFLWRGGAMTDLGALPGQALASARGINRAGTI